MIRHLSRFLYATISITLFFVAVGVSAEVTPSQPNVVPLRTYQYGALTPLLGKAIYVATDGSDRRGTGSITHPFATAGAASQRAQAGDVIVLKTGTYTTFGIVNATGTEEKPILVRPEPNGRVIVMTTPTSSSVVLQGSYIHLFGIEIDGERGASEAPCLVIGGASHDLFLRDLFVHDCTIGIRLASPTGSVAQTLMEDVTIASAKQRGITCEACTDIVARRLHLTAIGLTNASGIGVWMGASSAHMIIEDSEIATSESDGIVMEGTDATVSNSAIHHLTGSPIRLFHDGNVLNDDLRANAEAPELRAGGSYRYRGTLTEYVRTDADGFGFRLIYDAATNDVLTTLLLDGNRFVARTGGIGLPLVRASSSAPLLITMRSNTFFLLDPNAFATLPNGRRVTVTELANATGTGIVNLGANVAVGTAPTGDDLLSPVYAGGGTRTLPLGVMVFPGTRIKGSGSTIYVYADDGMRHAFPTESVYRSWFHAFDGIVELDDAALAKIPLGKNVTYRPGLRLVKVATEAKVYAVGEDATLRWVTNETIAKVLYGSMWNQQIDDIPDTLFINYTLGAPIDHGDDYHPKSERAEIANPSELF